MSSHHYNRRASSPSGLGNSRGSPPRGSPMPYRGGGKGTTINNSDDMTAAPSVVTAAETVRTDVATVETVEEKIARQRKLMKRRENGEHKKKESATAGVPMVIRDRRGSSNDLKKISSNVEKTTTRRRSDNSNNSKQDDGNGDTRRRINNERGGDKMISSSIEINISPKQDNGNGDTRRRISNERGGERKTSSGNGERRRDSGASSGDRRPSNEHGDRLPSGSSGNNNEVRRGSNSSSDRRPSDGSGNGERKRSTGSSGEHGVSSSTGRRVSGGNSNNERRSSGSSGGKTSEKIRRNRDGERSTSNGRRTTNGGSGRDNGPDKRRTDGTREKPPSQIQPSRRQHHHSQQQQQRQLLPPQPKPKIKEPAKRQPHPPPPVASNISSSSHRHDQLDSTNTHSSISSYQSISSYGKDHDDDDMDLVSLIHEVKSDHHRQYRSGSKGGRGEIKTGREGQRSKTHHSGSGDDHHHHSRINDSIPIDHREAQQKRDSRTLSPPPVTRRGNRLRRPSNESKNNSNNNSKGDKIMTSKGRQKTTSNSRPESEPRVGRMSIGRRRPPQSPSQIKGRGNGGGGESSDGEETATVFHPTGPSIKKKIKKRTTGGDDLQKAYLRGMKAANDGGNGESKTDTGSGMGGNGNGNNWISTSSKSTKAVNNIIKKNQEVYEPWLHRRDSLPGRPPSKEDVVDRKPIPNVQPLDPKGLDILNVGGIDMFTPQEHDVHDGDDPYLRRLSVPLEADSHFGDDQYRHSQPLNDKSKPIFPTMCVAGCQMEALEATHNKIIRGVKASKSFFPSDVLGVVRLLDGNDRCCDCRRGCMKEDYDKQQRSRRGGNDSDNREKKPIRMAKRLSLILNVTNDSGNMENMDDNNTSPDPVAKGLPIWASIPYGTLLCDECAFRHINISDEVIVKSKEKNLLVKSLIEDESWTLPEVISIVEGGNRSMISYMDQSKSKMAVYAAGGEESGTTDDDNNYNNRNNHYDKNGDHYEGGDGVGGGSRMNFTNKNDNEAFDDAFDAWYRGKAAMKYRKILRRRVELVLQETGCLLDSGREKVTTSASNIVNYEKGIVTMDASDGDNENNLGGTNHAIFSSDGSDVEGKGSKSARRLTSISTFDVGQLRIRRRASIGEDTVITRQTVKTYGR